MFFFKKIKQLEAQVKELKFRNQILEDRTIVLAERVAKGFNEIDQLYALLVNQKPEVPEQPVTVEEKPVTEQKPKRKHRPRKKNGKENPEATK